MFKRLCEWAKSFDFMAPRVIKIFIYLKTPIISMKITIVTGLRTEE